MTLEVDMQAHKLKDLHGVLLRQAAAEADTEAVRAAWRESEEREAARKRTETRRAWVLYYRRLEASFAARAERCGEQAKRLEKKEVNRNGQHDAEGTNP